MGNIPAAVPYTSTYALTNVTLPYLVELATLGEGVEVATKADPSLLLGLNTFNGEVTHEAVAEALGIEASTPSWIARATSSGHGA